MATPMCPECGSSVNVRGIPTLGQRLRCPDCRTELRVIGLQPLHLGWADEYREEEEEEDDDGSDG